MTRLCTGLLAFSLSVVPASATVGPMFPGPGMIGSSCAGDSSWASVVLLVVNDNQADATTAFDDQSTSNKTVTRGGDTQYDTAQAPTGMTSSALFDGTGDYLSLADHADWAFGSGDFTVEGFVRADILPAVVILLGQWDNGGNNSWLFEIDSGVLNFYYSTDGSGNRGAKALGTMSADTWYHFAVSRVGNTLDAYLGGTRGSSTDVTGITLFDSADVNEIGAYNLGASFNLTGWMASVRITKGVGRYSGASITPPSLPLPTTGC